MFARDYRRVAREALRGKWGAMLAVVLLADAVTIAFGLNAVYQLFFSEVRELELVGGYVYRYTAPVGLGIPLLALLYVIRAVAQMVKAGEFRAADALLRGERPIAGQLFPMELFWKALVMNIVRTILVGLQMFLLIVPGIIAGFRYSMADYLLAQNPELGPIEALRESRVRMRGNKFPWFCLRTSFFGWLLLTAVPLMMVRSMMQANASPAPLRLVYVAVSLLVMVPVDTYIEVASAAFFNRVYRGEPAGSIDVEPEMTQEEYDAAPEPDPEAVYTALSADETVAKDIFFQHGCLRSRMRDEGILEEYEKLHVSPSSEMAWVRDYGDELMRRFDRDPEALDELLALAAEYESEMLIDRALQRIDRHIRQETLPDEEILDMAGRALALLTSGAFDASGGFVNRKRTQVSDMADRLEHRLAQSAPEGEWRRAMELIRSMCGET